jgi:hypothetical protein
MSLWTSDHSFWVHIQRSVSDSRIHQIFSEWVRNRVHSASWGQLEELGKTSGSGFRKSRLTAMGNRLADYTTSSICKSWYFLTSGGRSVGIVHLRTKATEFKCCHLLLYCHIMISVLLLYYIITIIMYYYIVMILNLYSYIIILILFINLWLVPYHVKWSVDEINWIELNRIKAGLALPRPFLLYSQFFFPVLTAHWVPAGPKR